MIRSIAVFPTPGGNADKGRAFMMGFAASAAVALSLLIGHSARAADQADTQLKTHVPSGPAEKSLPSSAPEASRTQTTGATNQSSTVKAMNKDEKAKVESGGK